jgi:hypothetical protein
MPDNTRDTEARTDINYHPGIKVVDFHNTKPSSDSAILPTTPMEIKKPMERAQCTAKSKQSGVRCKRPPIRGHHVCAMHGGKSPQVIATAKQRLAAMVDPALVQLQALLLGAEAEPVRLAAVKDILDRNGYKPVDRIEVTDAGARLAELLAGRERARAARVTMTETRSITFEGAGAPQLEEKKGDSSDSKGIGREERCS